MGNTHTRTYEPAPVLDTYANNSYEYRILQSNAIYIDKK